MNAIEIIVMSLGVSSLMLIAVPVCWCRAAPEFALPAFLTAFLAGKCLSLWLQSRNERMRQTVWAVLTQVHFVVQILWWIVCFGFVQQYNENLISAFIDPTNSILSIKNPVAWIQVGLFCIRLLVTPAYRTGGRTGLESIQTQPSNPGDYCYSSTDTGTLTSSSSFSTYANAHADSMRHYIESGPGP